MAPFTFIAEQILNTNLKNARAELTLFYLV